MGILRSQTLLRTVSGFMNYSMRLPNLAQAKIASTIHHLTFEVNYESTHDPLVLLVSNATDTANSQNKCNQNKNADISPQAKTIQFSEEIKEERQTGSLLLTIWTWPKKGAKVANSS